MDRSKLHIAGISLFLLGLGLIVPFCVIWLVGEPNSWKAIAVVIVGFFIIFFSIVYEKKLIDSQLTIRIKPVRAEEEFAFTNDSLSELRSFKTMFKDSLLHAVKAKSQNNGETSMSIRHLFDSYESALKDFSFSLKATYQRNLLDKLEVIEQQYSEIVVNLAKKSAVARQSKRITADDISNVQLQAIEEMKIFISSQLTNNQTNP